MLVMIRVSVAIAVLAVAVPVAAAPKMLKGPYLQDLAPDSITIMWQLDEPEPARLTVTGPGGERTQDVGAAPIVEAKVDGLVPSSRYRYRVAVGTETWDGEFATAPPVGTDVPFSFIVVGDSRNDLEQHRRVAERMATEVPDFVLGTGDMVDEGFRQDQWQQFFDIENPLMRDNVLFPALGNHDRQGKGRTADTYRSYFSVPGNGDDTGRYYAFSYASARFLVLDSNAYSFALTDQTAWLERELMAARQDPGVRHIFVVMHHPPFSISLHGGARDLRERWTPLFAKYQVSAVFSGHDHVYERAEHEGVRYFVSGGGGAPLYPRRPKPNPVDAEAVKTFERALHYLRVTVTGDRIEVTAVRADGSLIETTSWTEASSSPQLSARAIAPAAGAASPALAAPVVPADSHGVIWLAGGALALLGASAFVLVRALRRER